MVAAPMELDMQLPEGPQTLDNPIFASHHSLQSIKDAIEAGFPVTDLQTKPVTVSFVYNPHDILGPVPDRILGMREGPLDGDVACQALIFTKRTSLEVMRHHVAVGYDDKGCQMMTHDDPTESVATSPRSMAAAPETKEATLGSHGEMVWWMDPQGNHNLAPAWSQGKQQGTQNPTLVELQAQLNTSTCPEDLLDTPDIEDIVSAARETTKNSDIVG